MKPTPAQRFVVNPSYEGHGGERITIQRKPIPPTGSWWVVKPEDFSAAHARELPQLVRSTGSQSPKLGENA